MARREQRWAIWKIVLLLVLMIACAVGLFAAGHYVGAGAQSADRDTHNDPGANLDFNMGNILQFLGAICCAMVVICIGWLVVRYYQSIPAWKKRAKLPAHRRK